jgi:hypothetical protein
MMRTNDGRKWVLFLVIIISIMGAGDRVNGQVLPLSGSKGFYEIYLDKPLVERPRGPSGVGPIIVGISADNGRKPFRPQNARVLIGERHDSLKEVCIRVLSRDGRYFAQNLYRIESDSGPSPLFEFHSNYIAQLSEYTTNDIAILALNDSLCKESLIVNHYVIAHNQADMPKTIIVQVRAGDARLHAQLGIDGTASGPAILCANIINGPTIGFTHECAIPIMTPAPQQASEKGARLAWAGPFFARGSHPWSTGWRVRDVTTTVELL